MNYIFKFFIFILLFSAGCISKKGTTQQTADIEKNQAIDHLNDFTEQSTWLLGYFARERLTEPPHSEWFVKGYEGYQVDTGVIESLKEPDTGAITVKIVLGTWCPDSRREVPRFMHILDFWEFPLENVTFIGVDDEKKSPVGEYLDLGIERVPTFIFYENYNEKGRIIENPVTSLEKDMASILRNE